MLKEAEYSSDINDKSGQIPPKRRRQSEKLQQEQETEEEEEEEGEEENEEERGDEEDSDEVPPSPPDIRVHMVADIGGTSVDEATRRMMRFMFSNELALTYNLTGKHGKNKFKDLHLFKVVHEALKKNPLTSTTNQQEAEWALSKRFTGARDRGGLRAARVSK
ncbi:nucleolar protein 12-like [Alosa sapidissima]|uniref:nucleolar protein 12-like n=1 Tax=Alosa sapidissima TaxID=34773 RepID=UPI001C0804E6|nr:nucleolar protein 12-like [Alosa sapidissima]